MTASWTPVRMVEHVWTKLTLTSVSAKKAGKEKSAASVRTTVISTQLEYIPYGITFPEALSSKFRLCHATIPLWIMAFNK